MINLSLLRTRITHALQRPIIRGTLWKLSSRIVSLFLQSAYFLIIARVLGAEQYGLFVGVMALVKLLVPISGWGTPHILVKNVSRNRALFKEYWGNALSVTAVLGVVLLVIVLLLNQFILPVHFPFALVLSIGLAELLFSRFFDAALKAFLATDLVKYDAQLNILLSINGLIAALCLLVFFQKPTALVWGILYLLSRIITTVAGLVLVHRTLGPPKPAIALMKSEIGQGFYFSIDLASQSIYNDIDKTMLASLSTLTATGAYGAAYRLIEVGMIPIVSLLGATYAHFFRKGAVGISGSLEFAKRIVPLAGTYGALTSVALWFCAPVVPYLLGNEYATAVEVLRWLSPLIFFKAMQYFAADTLTGAGLQGARSGLQVAIAVFNVLINLWLIPLYSWKGAAWASLASDGLLMLGLWGLVAFFHRKQSQSGSPH